MSDDLNVDAWLVGAMAGLTNDAPGNVLLFDEPAVEAEKSTVYEAGPREIVVIPQTDTGMGVARFYERILPSVGRFCLVEKKHYGMKHTWHNSQAAVVTATEQRSRTPDVYCGTMGFDDREQRRQVNVVAGKALRLDIDAGPEKVAMHGDKVYASVTDALAAVATFEDRSGLIASLIVKSGNGLHLYYTFAEDITDMPRWQAAAELLHRITLHYGLKIDTTVTTDSARILRPVGSLHNNGNRVHVIRESGDITLAQLQQCEARAGLANGAVKSSPATQKSQATVLLGDLEKRVEPSISQSRRACPTIRDPALTGSNEYGNYLLFMGVASHTSDPQEAADVLFGTYPGYDSAATMRKMASLTGGPPRCSTIAAQVPGARCGECQFKGRASTPIHAAQLLERRENPTAALQALPKEIADQVERVNGRYFVAPEGGECKLFVEFTHTETGQPGMKQVSDGSFRLEYANQSVPIVQRDGGVKQVNLAAYWRASPYRREYSGMGFCFDGQSPAGFYNLYKGLAVEVNSASAGRFLRHLRATVGNDSKSFRYLVQWMAFCVQRPGDRTETVVVFRGAEGTGKGTNARLLTSIFGPHALHISNGRHLTGNFNAHLRLALFLFVDEGYWAGDPAAEGVLKQLITEDQIMIEQKGVDAFMALNRLKVMIATNNEWAVPAGPTSRRFFVVDVPDTKRGDWAYWKQLNAWLDGGGRGATLNFLLNLNLSKFNIRDIPNTEALDDQKRLSMPPFLKWLESQLYDGSLWGGDEWETDAPCQLVTKSYAEYCAAHGRRHEPTDAKNVAAKLKAAFGTLPRRRRGNGSRHYVWIVPPLTEARYLFCNHAGIESPDWPDE